MIVESNLIKFDHYQLYFLVCFRQHVQNITQLHQSILKLNTRHNMYRLPDYFYEKIKKNPRKPEEKKQPSRQKKHLKNTIFGP